MSTGDQYIINVSGRKFEISSNTYRKMENYLKKDSVGFEPGKTEIFIERTASCVESIISYYQGRKLHMPMGVCPAEFREELEFWEIPINNLSRCCLTRFMSFSDDQNHIDKMESDENGHERETLDLNQRVKGQGWVRFQARVWQVLQEPSSSIMAKVYSYASSIVIAMSILSLICGTHPFFRRDLNEEEWRDFFEDDFHLYEGHFDSSKRDNSTLPKLPSNARAHVDLIAYTELITVAFFSIEIFVRFVFCPYKTYFFKSMLNWIDIFSITVMYSKYIVEALDPKEKYQASIFDIVHCLQIVRVFRLFRLVKNNVGFRVLLHAFKSSLQELLLMSMLLFVSMLFFSSFAFFSGDEVFASIPDSFWWSIVTMTTVGYGDVVPRQALSKIVGAMCAITGVLILAVVIPVFVNNFLLFYSYSKIWKYHEANCSFGRSNSNDNKNSGSVAFVKVAPINASKSFFSESDGQIKNP
ncbi:hypothetical protein FSP39_011010 [Pinctada imbricata]|uniref:Uncharacterized protein n=1 Tax=Pinctada imbricata TaxID=66713 RepID=A0AA88YH64_PINIB|nr:hypothetical protein FSP39_011010 [Pinctada imbricata]